MNRSPATRPPAISAERHARSLAAAACIVLLASCSTPKPPAPPEVDETTTRPANNPQTLEMLRLRTQVHNLKLQVDAQSRTRQAETLAAAAATLREAATHQSETPPHPAPANQVFVIPYAFGETDVRLDAAELARLVESAKTAAYVMVRGRTDGTLDTRAEARISRERSVEMKSFLVGAGVDPSRIRVTYQPTGDHLSDNGSAAGRDLNRRVEVELYAVRPLVSVLGANNKLQ
jgi:outer membrane protein OmpA-like peptidoglycan-associated protein